jgi:hypothetical protein
MTMGTDGGVRRRASLSKQDRQQGADGDHSTQNRYGIEEGSKCTHGMYLCDRKRVGERVCRALRLSPRFAFDARD